MRRASARAYSNMALVKYWGKRDERLILPTNSSLSMTLDRYYTTTSVTFDAGLDQDEFYLNEYEATEKERERVSRFLEHVRRIARESTYATVHSTNNVPTEAGLASSASGFAALAAACSQALDLPLDGASLSRLARQGSGSSSRSIYGGFVEWRRGILNAGTDSYAIPVAPEDHWALSMVVATVGTGRKGISSREGMRRSVETSPYYQGWLDSVEGDLRTAKRAIKIKDFHTLGQVVESNAFKMHALTHSANPPFTYWQEGTLSVMKKVWELRESGIPAYFTMDAGPNVAVLCENDHAERIHEALAAVDGVQDTVICRPGPGIALLG